MANTLEFRAGGLTLAALRRIYEQPVALRLTAQDRGRIAVASSLVDKIIAVGDAAYGINTGFGLLAQTRIPTEQLELLQRNLLLSHAAGVGDALPDAIVRLILALKINALARGHSGVTLGLIEALLALLEHEVYPVIPSQGSVGASGDLAPLAHLSAVLLGLGQVRVRGVVIPAADGLRQAGLAPIRLHAKEGLALINGTQVSTALGLAGLFARPPIGTSLPAWSLTADQAILTALGNDVGFELVFARQLIARAKAGDIAIAMSTSGNSPNLLAALAEARQRGLYTIGFAGYDGGAFVNNPHVDASFVVRSQSVHRIQEAQALLGYQLWLAVHERCGDQGLGAA